MGESHEFPSFCSQLSFPLTQCWHHMASPGEASREQQSATQTIPTMSQFREGAALLLWPVPCWASLLNNAGLRGTASCPLGAELTSPIHLTQASQQGVLTWSSFSSTPAQLPTMGTGPA